MIGRFCRVASVVAAVCGVLGYPVVAASAEETVLRVSHFLPATSTVHVELVEPWARAVEAQSKGRLKVEIYPAMQFGGRPAQLYDQVRDGVADIVWTLPGYTPGRFPKSEVFELPFMATTAEATSQALHEFYGLHLADEFADIHPILFHAHAPGSFHMRGKPVTRLEDLAGLKVRAPTRVINDALAAMGATPVGMPVPQVPEALSKGVVDGAVLPYEVTTSLRVHELTDSHTSVVGEHGFYTAVFLFAMNRERYLSLPDDLKRVIDDNSGLPLARRIGRVWDAAEETGIAAARGEGAAFHTIEGAEVERWKAATQPVIDAWVAEMDAKGFDGRRLLEDARALIAKYGSGN